MLKVMAPMLRGLLVMLLGAWLMGSSTAAVAQTTPPPSSSSPTQPTKSQITAADMYNLLMYSCWVCPISAMIVDLSFSLGENMHDFFGDPLKKLVGVFLALWLLFHAAKLMMPFGSMDGAAGMFNQIAARLVLVSMVLAALNSFDFFDEYIFKPTVWAGVRSTSVVTEVLFKPTVDSNGNAVDPILVLTPPWDQFDPTKSPTRSVKQPSGSYTTQPVPAPEGGNITCSNFNFTTTAGIKMVLNCQFYALQRAIGVGVVAGIASMQKMQWGTPPTGWDWLLSGFLMMLLYGTAGLLVGLYMLTYLFRWMFIAVVSPLAIAGFAFPITRKPAKLCIHGLIHSAIGFMMISLLVNICIAMLSVSFGEALGASTVKSTPADGSEVVTKMMGSLEAAGDANSFASGSYWLMMASGVILLMFARKIENWSSQYIEGSFSVDVGGDLVGEAVKSAKMGQSGLMGMVKKL
jgi:hypothetical protein